MTCSECFKPIEDDDVVEWSDGRPTHISCWERVQERKRKNKKPKKKETSYMKDQIEIKTQWRINFTKYWDIVRYVENSIENKYREYGKGVLETGEAGFHSSSLRYVSGIIRPANLSDFRSDVKYILNSVPMCSYFDS